MRAKPITLFMVILSLGITLGWGQNQKDEPGEIARKLFSRGKRVIYQKDWEAAIKHFKHIVTKYRDSAYCEPSHYWLAYSLNKLGQEQSDTEKEIATKEDALEQIEKLKSRFPLGKWVDDAEALQLEIAEDLAGKGLTQYKKLIEDRIKKDADDDLKIVAIGTLIDMGQVERAFDQLEKIFSKKDHLKQKKKVLVLLSHIQHPRSFALLADIALKESDKILKKLAISNLGNFRNARSLTELLKIYHTVKDNTLKQSVIFSIYRIGSTEAVKKLIEIYRQEKSLQNKKSIIFWLGRSSHREAQDFILKILDEEN